ncbi:MAG: GNAT family N-acetyltransferase [Promethearchaeota archaeon]
MPVIRKATLEDLDELVKLRLALLCEMVELDENYKAKLAESIQEYFVTKIPKNEFYAWVAENDGQIIASSGLVFHQKPPIHGNLTGREAYIMNMYTLPNWRNKGIATKLLNEVLKFVKEKNLIRIRLHATDAGRKIYEKAGFIPDFTEMVLDW